jgi:hypothetical protein
LLLEAVGTWQVVLVYSGEQLPLRYGHADVHVGRQTQVCRVAVDANARILSLKRVAMSSEPSLLQSSRISNS